MSLTEKDAKKRISALLQYIFVVAPAFAEILMWIPCRYDGNKKVIAYATEKAIYFCPRFFEMPPKEQLFVLLHEMWHVALRHCERRKALRAHPLIANMAMDVLINECLTEMIRKLNEEQGRSWLTCPESMLDVAWVEQATQQKLKKHWSQYDWYELYQFLLDNLPRCTPDEPGIYIDSSYFDDPSAPPQRLKLEGQLPEDLFTDPNPEETDESENEETKESFWKTRIQQALAGDKTGSFIQPFLDLLPKEKTISWTKLYEKFLQNWGLRHTLQTTYARPHRRSLTGVVNYVLPSTRPTTGLLPVAIVFDTSGSIPDEDLEKFAHHTDAFREAYEFELEMWVIMVDCEVKSTTMLMPGETLASYLRQNKIQFQGRGGTSFIPGLAEASRLGAKLCVYFTDLCGDFGTPPQGMDVLWVVNNENEAEPPFGRCIRLPECTER